MRIEITPEQMVSLKIAWDDVRLGCWANIILGEPTEIRSTPDGPVTGYVWDHPRLDPDGAAVFLNSLTNPAAVRAIIRKMETVRGQDRVRPDRKSLHSRMRELAKASLDSLAVEREKPNGDPVKLVTDSIRAVRTPSPRARGNI